MSRHFWDIVLILDRLLVFGATHVWKAIRSLLHTLPGLTVDSTTHKWTKGRIVWGHSVLYYCCIPFRRKFGDEVKIQFPNIYSIWGKLSIFMAHELFDLEVLYGPSSSYSGLWSSLALPITLSYSLKRGRWLGSTITVARRNLQRQTEFVAFFIEIFFTNNFM